MLLHFLVLSCDELELSLQLRAHAQELSNLVSASQRASSIRSFYQRLNSTTYLASAFSYQHWLQDLLSMLHWASALPVKLSSEFPFLLLSSLVKYSRHLGLYLRVPRLWHPLSDATSSLAFEILFWSGMSDLSANCPNRWMCHHCLER